ncbi:hypothetical protein GOE08_21080 [Sinorhizobium medicae]|nr:hypothetical protein [Sinorhizobium medicae]
MRAWIFSDLHTELSRAKESLSVPDADICLRAGDICDHGPASAVTNRGEHVSAKMPVIVVAGNHDYYRSSIVEGGREALTWAKRAGFAASPGTALYFARTGGRGLPKNKVVKAPFEGVLARAARNLDPRPHGFSDEGLEREGDGSDGRCRPSCSEQAFDPAPTVGGGRVRGRPRGVRERNGRTCAPHLGARKPSQPQRQSHRSDAGDLQSAPLSRETHVRFRSATCNRSRQLSNPMCRRRLCLHPRTMSRENLRLEETSMPRSLPGRRPRPFRTIRGPVTHPVFRPTGTVIAKRAKPFPNQETASEVI